MISRRQTIALIAAVPLLTRDALAQEDRNAVKDLFGAALDYLKDPARVAESYRRLYYYVDLLQRIPPKVASATPDTPRDALRTYSLLGEAIARSEAKFDGTAGTKIFDELVESYAERQKQLWEYCEQVGINVGAPAEKLIEEAIASMMLFYGAAVKAVKFAETKFCICPFCFGHPG